MDFAADVDIFFADSPYSLTVGAETIPCLFDNPFDTTDMFTGQVATSAPVATVRSTDVTALGIGYGTQVAVLKNGSQLHTGRVTSLQPDGEGLTRLVLEFDVMEA
ncbi:MAG: hypothetical protein ACM31P_02215 [Actinomycetota bacterium]